LDISNIRCIFVRNLIVMIIRRFKKIGRNQLCPCGSEDLFLDVYELYDLYTSGKTLDELGELIGRSRRTISRLFIKHNLADGLCTKCNQYDRTVSQRGYEREYDLDGKRIFSQEHIEKLKQARIIVAQRKKFKKCECSKDIETIKYINLSKK